jgi:HK97 family phage prohead protease
MLKKVCELSDFKLLDEGSGSFSGYGSTFGTVDRAGEFVTKGAFLKSLPAFKENGFIAVGHDWDGLPVATISEAYEDAKGLFIKCDFHTTDEAQQARKWAQERMARGKSVGLSIGYSVKDSEPTKSGLALKEIELFEVSLVTVPCNPAANATSVKAAPETKAQYLGAYAEGDATWAALQALTNGLCWNGIEPALFDMSRPKEERLADVDAALSEFHQIAMTILTALLPESDAQKAASLAEFKALWPAPDVAEAPAAKADEQLTTLLADAQRCQERQAEIAALRAKEGRPLSQDRRQKLAELASALTALAAPPATSPLVKETAEALLSHYAEKQRRRQPATT